MKLNQEKFARAYAICGNATRSYLKANPNVSYDTARTEGSKLLAKPEIQEKIKEFKDFDNSEDVLIVNELRERLRTFITNKFDDLEALRKVLLDRIPVMAKYNSTELLNMARYNSLTIQDFAKLVELIGVLEGYGGIESYIIETNKDTIGDMGIQYDDPLLPT